MQLITALFCSNLALCPCVPTETKDWGEIRLSVTKERFLQGEPIGVHIRVVNRTDRELGLIEDYPTFGRFTSQSGTLRFSNIKGGKALAFTLTPTPNRDGGGKCSIGRVPAREDWETTIYLQRFASQPKPGKYEIAFKIGLKLYSLRPEKEPITRLDQDDWQTQYAKGKLSFTVDLADVQKLDAIYADLGRQVCGGKYHRAREAAEALCVVEDPAVVPYLFAVLKHGWRPDDAAEALLRHSKGKDPYSILTGLLAQKDPTAVGKILGIMAAAKYEIGPTRARRLLADEREGVRKAARQYVLALNDEEYLKLLTER